MSLAYRVKRWMYRDGRPNRLARALNRISAVHFGSGRLASDGWVELAVRGRKSGKPITFPIVLVDHEGERYLVSMLGEANWVRNVRADNGRAVIRHGRVENVRLDEVDPADRAPILRRYLALAPGGRPHIPVDQNAPVEAFEPIAARYPVFRVTPWK